MPPTTKIEWCDSTVNPTPCCTGCELYPKHCYAAGMQRRWGGNNAGWPTSFTAPTCYEGRIAEACRWRDLTGKPRPKKPWLDGMPRVIFVDDCGDPFAPFADRRWWPQTHWLAAELDRMAAAPHIWVVLTKWPERMAEFTRWHGPFPVNCWVGTSITDQSTAEARTPHLLQVDASVRFLSMEPLLGPLLLDQRTLGCRICTQQNVEAYPDPCSVCPRGIDGAIVGGETGTGARPMHPQWARDVRDACVAAGVPYFHKHNGEWIHESQANTSWPLKNAVAEAARSARTYRWLDNSFSYRVGKPAAGRLLDGRTWDGLPKGD